MYQFCGEASDVSVRHSSKMDAVAVCYRVWSWCYQTWHMIEVRYRTSKNLAWPKAWLDCAISAADAVNSAYGSFLR